ncbi:Uncharacterised protein [Raoultella ornithinolytica]|nr:Uncharacterised protein [Raoultella ornithinolytica]
MPGDARDAGFPPQRAVAAPAGGQQRHTGQALRTAGEIGHIPFAGVGLQQRTVAAFLQRIFRQMPAGHQRPVRMQFVRPVDIFRSEHHHRMFITGAAFGHQQIVPALFMVQMGPFGIAQRCAGKQGFSRLRQGLRLREILLQDDRTVRVTVVTRPPRAVNIIFTPVRIVKQRRVKAAVTHRDRFTPRPLNRGGGDQIVATVFPRRVDDFHIGIQQPEQPVGVAQTRRPDPAGVGVAFHIQHRHAIQRRAHQRPVFQIPRVVNPHSRKPLEGGGGDVVILALATH